MKKQVCIRRSFSSVFLLFYFTGITSFAQTLKGRVVDAFSQRPIGGATLAFINLDKTLLSDSSGYFRFQPIPIGRYTLKISCIGYESTQIPEILVSSGKETELLVSLTERGIALEEVQIRTERERGNSLNDMATVSVKSLSVEQTKRYAATWGDPARMALSFAGTSNANDQTNEIVIRGNSPKGMLWKIEGVEVPNPSHFSLEGASGGGLSALSPTILGTSDFYTGAFPAEYGNATSGVFDVRMRQGNRDKRETSIQLGLNGIEAGTEGPFSKKSKASYLINYRYSTLALLRNNFLSTFPGVPIFQDLAGKVVIPMKNQTVSIWGIGGNSRFDYDNSDAFRLTEKSSMYASGINWVKYLRPNVFVETILSASGQRVNVGTELILPGRGLTDIQNTNYQFLRLSSQYNQKINEKHSVRAGLIATQMRYDLSNVVVFDCVPRIGRLESRKLDDRGESYYVQGYGQWKMKVSSKLTLNLGLHSTFFALNQQINLEPRFGARYHISPKGVLTAGYGVHSRLEPLSIYLSNGVKLPDGTKAFPNKDLKMPQATHYVVGYEWRPVSTWRLLSEVYLQQLRGIGVANNSQLFPNLSLANELDVNMTNMPQFVSSGSGENYGVELTVERFLAKGFYVTGTSSIFQSTFTNLQSESFTARFNQNFVHNLLAGKEWIVGKRKSNVFGLNFRATYGGGVRVIPIDLEASKKRGVEVLDYTQIYNQQQLPDFFRMDLKINFIKNHKNTTSTFSLDLNNVTNRENPRRVYYDSVTQSIQTIHHLGILPILLYRLEF